MFSYAIIAWITVKKNSQNYAGFLDKGEKHVKKPKIRKNDTHSVRMA
jgi:hypothetical protein